MACGCSASLSRTAIAPAAPRSSAVTQRPSSHGRIAVKNRVSTPKARGSLGSKSTPPFAPPTGRPKAAVLVAMPRARSPTSLIVQPGRMRVPPVAMPPTRVWTTRYPCAPVTGSTQVIWCAGSRSTKSCAGLVVWVAVMVMTANLKRGRSTASVSA